MDLGSVLSNAASGGLIGLGGALAGQVVGYFKEKQAAQDALAAKQLDYAHEKEMAAIAGTAAQAAGAREQALARLTGEYEGLKASIADQTALSASVSGWARDLLAVFRPVLTFMLMTGAMITAMDKIPLFNFTPRAGTFDAFIQLSALAVAWWFGSRDQAKAAKA